MLLLTGATGLVGSAVLRRLTAAQVPVRCLVRDPRRLGPERVRVQIALGDLADPPSFRNALRGVTTVVHLAAAIRDQPRGSIEELNGIATWRMVQAAEAAGVRRFVFFTALTRQRARPHALPARQGAGRAGGPGLRPRARRGRAVDRLRPRRRLHDAAEPDGAGALVPVSGSGRARYQPIWAEDVARCVTALLDEDAPQARYELAGPETLDYTQITSCSCAPPAARAA